MKLQIENEVHSIKNYFIYIVLMYNNCKMLLVLHKENELYYKNIYYNMLDYMYYFR